jgi:uncharacterized protein Yka (UPF0111/DUF47 family)
MSDEKIGFWPRLVRRFVPEVPDFATLLEQQSAQVRKTIDDLVEYVRHPDATLRDQLHRDEEEAGKLRDENMRRLNNAFSTPFDRDDIYRAIEALDWIVVHTRRTAREMEILGVTPDNFIREICLEIQTGVTALGIGFAQLGSDMEGASRQAEAARRIDRRARHIYEEALGELFKGDDVLDMLKRREIYHHLADGAKRVHKTAEVLQDIVVKTA